MLEHTLRYRWRTLAPAQRAHVRTALFDHLAANHARLPPFVATKVAATVVHTGRLDWPQEYPGFLDKVLRAAAVPGATASFGVALLKLTCEEFTAAGRAGVTCACGLLAERRVAVQQHLTNALPSIFALLVQLLQRAAAELASAPGAGGARRAAPTTTAKAALETLAQLLQWAPLSDELVTPGMAATLFAFVEQAPDPVHSAAAAACLIELVDKLRVPRAGYVLEVATHMLAVLRALVDDAGARDDERSTKITEFLRVFLSRHIGRIAGSPQFPMPQFLALLFTFTFQRSTASSFVCCLDVWALFVDFVLDEWQQADERARLTPYFDGLTAVATRLVDHVSWATNAAFLCQLDGDDDDDVEGKLTNGGNGAAKESGWRDFDGNSGAAGSASASPCGGPETRSGFTQRAVDLVGKIVQIPGCTDKVLAAIFPKLQTRLGAYTAAGQAGAEAFGAACRDLCTLLRMIPVMHFVIHFEASVETAKQLVLAATHVVAAQGARGAPGRDHADLLVEAYDFMRSFSGWFVAYAEGANDPAGFGRLIAGCVAQAAETLDAAARPPGPPARVQLAAVRLLHSLAANVRPRVPVAARAMPGLERVLCHQLQAVAGPLPLPVQCRLVVAASSITVVPVSKMRAGTPDWEAQRAPYAAQMGVFAARLASAAERRDALAADANAVREVCRCAQVLSALSLSVRTLPTAAKAFVYPVLQPALPAALALLPVCVLPAASGGATGNTAELMAASRTLLDLLLAMFDAMRRQVGTSASKQIVEVLVALFATPALSASVLGGGAGGGAGNTNPRGGRGGALVVYKLLRFLSSLVAEPTAAFNALIPQILALCLDNLFPVLFASDHSAELLHAFFVLLREILVARWRCFVSSSVANRASSRISGGSKPSSSTFVSEAARQRFFQMMELLLNSFKRADLPPDAVGINLNTLETLSKKHRLLTLPAFKDAMLPAFLKTLLGALVNQMHTLSHEDIVRVIYRFSAADFDLFFGTVVAGIIRDSARLSPASKAHLVKTLTRAQDLPTFSSNLIGFVNNLLILSECGPSYVL